MGTLFLPPDLLTGLEDIDGHHRTLFEWANQVMHEDPHGPPSDSRRALVYLAGYVRFHFAAEERAMTMAAYPEREAHARQHEAFRKEIEALRDTVTLAGLTEQNRHRLHWLFREWLRQHIGTDDRALAAWLKAHPPLEAARPMPTPEQMMDSGLVRKIDLPPDVKHLDAADVSVRVQSIPGQVSPSEARARTKPR